MLRLVFVLVVLALLPAVAFAQEGGSGFGIALTLENLIAAVTALVTCAAALAALTNSDKDDAAISGFRKVLNGLALNVGGASNATQADIARRPGSNT